MTSHPADGHHRHHLSFPTRRSSDLSIPSNCCEKTVIIKFLLRKTKLTLTCFPLVCNIIYSNIFTISRNRFQKFALKLSQEDRKSTRLNSSHVRTSYAVLCLKHRTPR